MKARAFVDRAGEKLYLVDFNWLVSQMVVEGVEYDPVELLEMIVMECGSCKHHVIARRFKFASRAEDLQAPQ
jgi:hypothetical protein